MSELRLKSTGTIKLFENDNTSSVTIASPASLGGDRTITLPDASVTLASGTMLATDGSGASLTGLPDNTPAFSVSNTNNNTGKTDNAWSKLGWNSENYDTDSAFASDKFTVPADKAGKYFFTTNTFLVGDAASCVDFAVAFYKNGGSELTMAGNDFDFDNVSPTFSVTLDLAVSDYIEVYAKVNTSSGAWGQYSGGFFIGHKLIG